MAYRLLDHNVKKRPSARSILEEFPDYKTELLSASQETMSQDT